MTKILKQDVGKLGQGNLPESRNKRERNSKYKWINNIRIPIPSSSRSQNLTNRSFLNYRENWEEAISKVIKPKIPRTESLQTYPRTKCCYKSSDSKNSPRAQHEETKGDL